MILFKGRVSVQGVSVSGVSPGGSLSRGWSLSRGLCPGDSLLSTGCLCLGGLWGFCLGVSVWGVSVWGFSVQGRLCTGGLCPGKSLSRGGLFQETPLYSYVQAVRILQDCILVQQSCQFGIKKHQKSYLKWEVNVGIIGKTSGGPTLQGIVPTWEILDPPLITFQNSK